MKKRVLLFLVIIIAIMVIACPVNPPAEDSNGDTDPDPPVNNPPSATISPVDMFSGSAVEGNTLTILYTFSDPDSGDTEGTSTFRWFLCADPGDAGTEISGATSVSYTIQAGDAGSYLKAEVTPVDNHGLAGTAVVSSASDLITVPVNNAPSAAIPDPGMEVVGAGESGVNGVYDETGSYNGKPLYTQVVGSNQIFWKNFTGPPTGDFWCIDPDETSTDINEMNYISFSNADTPPLQAAVWNAWESSGPAPSLVAIPFTDEAIVGNTLTIQYVFSDPDAGDTEGASTFRWFLCADPGDAGTEISGATSVSYTIQAGDAGSYLKAEVTPVDNHGLAGTAVVSSASAQIP